MEDILIEYKNRIEQLEGQIKTYEQNINAYAMAQISRVNNKNEALKNEIAAITKAKEIDSECISNLQKLVQDVIIPINPAHIMAKCPTIDKAIIWFCTEQSISINSHRETLRKIADWNSHDIKLGVDYGSNGVRDFYRRVAKLALTK